MTAQAQAAQKAAKSLDTFHAEIRDLVRETIKIGTPVRIWHFADGSSLRITEKTDRFGNVRSRSVSLR